MDDEMNIDFMCFANSVFIYMLNKSFRDQAMRQTQRDIALLENSRKLLQLALEERR